MAFVFYSQSAYAGVPYPSPVLPYATVKSGGCGVCSASMIIENLTENSFPPEKAAEYSMKNGGRVVGGTDMLALGRALARDFELEFTTSNSAEALARALESGGMAVANVGGDRVGYVGVFSDGGHYVVAAAIDGESLTVLDPAYYVGKFTKAGRAGKVEVLGGGELRTSLSVLAADCQSRSPRYYIFAPKNRKEVTNY